MTSPDTPLNRRGTPRTRFDPLRDAPRAENAELSAQDAFLLENGLSKADLDENPADFPVLSLIAAVRRQIIALGLAKTSEGAMAVTAAEKAEEATGSAAAACLHELRMIMDAIRAAKPVEKAGDATEDVLSRRRERKGGRVITRDDLQIVFDMANRPVKSERTREALWAIERELAAAADPSVADTVWLMESGAGA